MPDLAELRLLGGFRLEASQARAISVASLKGRALLSYLACAKGRSASREHLALLLWSDSDSRKSRRNLRQVVLKLSRTLAEHGLSILQVDARTIALRVDRLWADVWDLEPPPEERSLTDLSRAGQVYDGEFLRGLALDAPIFSDWLTDTRAHFQSRALLYLHTLLERQRQTGDLGAAIATATRELEIDPCQEPAHRHLMELYLAKGSRSAALNQYRVCRAVLHRELDVAPDDKTEALYRRIHAQTAEPALGEVGVRAATSPPRGDESRESQSQVTRPVLAGRSAELKALYEAFAEASAGGARLFALRGEAGIGKTRLLDAFAEELTRHGVPFHRAAARRADRLMSLGFWAHIMDRWSGPGDRATGHRELYEAPLPYASRRDAVGGPVLPARDPWSRSFDNVLEKLREGAALGPLAVILEDIQWADGDSLRLISRALHGLRQAPVLFVTAARPGEEKEPARFAPVLRDLERARLVRHWELAPLSFADSMELIDRTLTARGIPDRGERWRKRIWAAAQGNPEILLAGLDPAAGSGAPDLPANLLRSARQTLARISAQARSLVRIASMMQGPARLAVCARAAKLEPPRAAEALQEAIAASLVRADPESFVFTRAWLRQAIRDDVQADRRRVLHAAIVAAIREIDAEELAPHYDALAHHCSAAGELVQAAEYRLSALALSIRRGMTRGVSSSLDGLARGLPERPLDPRIEAVRWRAGFLGAAIAEAKTGPASARARLRALEARGPPDHDPGAAIAQYYGLSRALCAAGERDEGLRYARRALRLSARHGGVHGPWHLAERLLFRRHLYGPVACEVVTALSERHRRARQLSVWADVAEIAAAQAMMEGLGGEIANMTSSFGAARAAAAKLRDARAEAAVLQIEGAVLTWACNASKALVALDRALELSQATGDLIRACVVRGLRGLALLSLGRLEEAKSDLEQAIAAANELGHIPYLPLFLAWLAEISGRSGQREAALRHARHAWSLSRGQTWNRPPILRVLARALAHATPSDIRSAEWAARQAIAIQRALRIYVAVPMSHLAHAEVKRAAGDLAGSQALFQEARQLLRGMGLGSQAAGTERLARRS